MSARELQNQKAVPRELIAQQDANGEVSASPRRRNTICSIKNRREHTPESTAENGFCEPAATSLLPVTRVDAASLIRILRQLEFMAKRQSPRIAFKAKGKILFLDLAEIVAVQAEGNYVSLRHRHNPYLLRESLSSMAEKLNPYGFIRIHRSVVVNISAVEEIQPLPTGEYRLRVKGGKEYLVRVRIKTSSEIWLNCGWAQSGFADNGKSAGFGAAMGPWRKEPRESRRRRHIFIKSQNASSWHFLLSATV